MDRDIRQARQVLPGDLAGLQIDADDLAALWRMPPEQRRDPPVSAARIEDASLVREVGCEPLSAAESVSRQDPAQDLGSLVVRLLECERGVAAPLVAERHAESVTAPDLRRPALRA
jgi:hypothetical protein